MNKFVALFLMWPVSSAFADSGLDQLKQSFAELIQSSTARLNDVAAMKPINLALGKEISKEACEALQSGIKVNYKVDPFHYVYEGGWAKSNICGGESGLEKNYLLNQASISNLGMPYAKVIQLPYVNNSGWRDDILNCFVDASDRIVEIQTLSFEKQTKELLSYDIAAVDQAGNVYMSRFDKNYHLLGGLAEDVSGTRRVEKYLPADGSLTTPMEKVSVTHPSNPAKDYQTLSWHRADKKDWQDYQIPITFAFNGGFYGYNGKYYQAPTKPTFQSGLQIKSRGGKEFCALGTVRADTERMTYPEVQKDFEDCLYY